MDNVLTAKEVTFDLDWMSLRKNRKIAFFPKVCCLTCRNVLSRRYFSLVDKQRKASIMSGLWFLSADGQNCTPFFKNDFKIIPLRLIYEVLTCGIKVGLRITIPKYRIKTEPTLIYILLVSKSIA